MKILVDTNVIVAASINENVTEIGIPVKHQFYDQSSYLFGIFRRRLGDRIGIVTATIESESFYTLAGAVNAAIHVIGGDPTQKRKLFDQATAIMNLCEDKMRKNTNILLREPVSETDVVNNLQLVDKMSEELKRLWEQKYGSKYAKEKESWERAKPILNAPWKGMDKQEIIRMYREQIEGEAKQLSRFMDKYPNLPDSKILAEAISILQHYEKGKEPITFLIASCDTGFFSPLRMKGGFLSNIVTTEIKNRFKITCDFPDKIIPDINK